MHLVPRRWLKAVPHCHSTPMLLVWNPSATKWPPRKVGVDTIVHPRHLFTLLIPKRQTSHPWDPWEVYLYDVLHLAPWVTPEVGWMMGALTMPTPLIRHAHATALPRSKIYRCLPPPPVPSILGHTVFVFRLIPSAPCAALTRCERR